MRKLLVLVGLLLAVVFWAKTVTLEFWTLSLSPTFDDYIKAMIADFEKQNPDIKINWIDVPYAAGVQRLTAAIAARKAPDVVNLNTVWAIDFAAQGALAPLDDLITPRDKALYWERLWNSTVLDGKSYAFPWYASIPIMMYNTELFRKAGLNPNQPPETWEQVLMYSRIIKTRLGIYGFQPNIVALEELLLEGVPIVTPDGKRAAFNTPEALARLRFFVNAYKEDLMPRSLGGYVEGREKFQAGQVAMYPAGLTMLQHIEKNAPSIYKVTEVAPHPVGKAKLIKVALMNLVIPAIAPNKEAAAKFALHVTSPKWQIEFSNYATVVPSTKQGLETSKVFQDRVAKGDLAAKAMLMASKSMARAVDLNAITVHRIPADKFADVRKILQDYWMAAIKGEIKPEEALAKAEAEVNRVLAR